MKKILRIGFIRRRFGGSDWCVQAHFVRGNHGTKRRVVSLGGSKRDQIIAAMKLWCKNPNEYRLG